VRAPQPVLVRSSQALRLCLGLRGSF
jgi:hypothetical protein